MSTPMPERPAADQLPSLEEYLEFEETSVLKHEYVSGGIYALAGATKTHNQITLNLATRLLASARGGPCRVYALDVKLRAAEDVIYYPDVMVACGPRTENPLIEDAPCLVIEVISPSTEQTDLREKVFMYKRMPTVKAYMIVHQDKRRVERYWRDEERWRFADAVGSGPIRIPCPETEITLDEIYEDTDVPA
jgi:Uma2 family endonuclease